jgi:hypothetical protein
MPRRSSSVDDLMSLFTYTAGVGKMNAVLNTVFAV